MSCRAAVSDKTETQKLLCHFGESPALCGHNGLSIFRLGVDRHRVEFASHPLSKERSLDILVETIANRKIEAVVPLSAGEWNRGAIECAGYQYDGKGERYHIAGTPRRVT